MPGLGVARISRLAISIVLIALGVTQTAPVEVNAAGESWFNSSWQFRKSITIDATKVSSGPHTDFPVLINLSSDSSLAANAQADGDDILFTSSGGATQLSHEIEKYGSATGALVAWVKVPSLSSGTETVLFMYYNNGSATSQQDATGVWSSGYEAVYHLNGNFLDSTSNARTATNSGTVDATGRTANGRDFEYSDSTDRLSLGTWNVTGSNLTVQTWVNFEGFTQSDARLVTKGISENEQDHVFMLSTDLSGANEVLRMRIKTGTNDAANTTTFVATSGALSTGTWYLAAATYDGANMTLYLNGTGVGSTAKTGSLRENSWGITAGNNLTGTNQPLDGILDEIRISSAARSAGWLTTEFNNQGTPTTFYAVGSATVEATKVVFVQQPSDATPGGTISPPVTVQLQNANSNNVSTAGVSITMTLSSGTGVLSGTTPTTTNASGLATFSNLSINLEGSKNLTASSTGLTSAVSNAFTISVGGEPPPPPPRVTLTINSTSPSNSATGVAVNTTVSATFSLLIERINFKYKHL